MPFLNPKQLILSTRKLPEVQNDALAIAREIVRMAPHVRVTLACPRDTIRTLPVAWDIPAVTVGLGARLGRLVPPRGAIFENTPVKKLDQFMRFGSADI